MFKKIIEFFKRMFYIIKIAKKPTQSEIKKLLKFILFLVFSIGILGFIFYSIELLLNL